jgi:hypothetical protein
MIRLPMRGIDYLENRMNLYPSYSTVIFEDAGERGYGIIKTTVHPPRPRWCL